MQIVVQVYASVEKTIKTSSKPLIVGAHASITISLFCRLFHNTGIQHEAQIPFYGLYHCSCRAAMSRGKHLSPMVEK